MPLHQIIGYNGYDINDDLTASQVLANELREIYDLHPISEERTSPDIITNLNGFFKDYVDSGENPVDYVIKACRENIS
jgi:hypothetical protein